MSLSLYMTGTSISQYGVRINTSTPDRAGSAVFTCTRNGTISKPSRLIPNRSLIILIHILTIHYDSYAGWWGHDPVTRFAMPPTFSAIPGAQGYQQSNPSVFATASLLGSLHIFKEAGLMPVLRARSLELTGFLEKKLHESKFYVPSESNLSEVSKPSFTIITPSDPASRGAQLSLVFLPNGNEVNDVMRSVSKGLASYGVVGDKREPDVIRLAPTPLYNTLGDCERAASVLEEILAELQ